MKAAKRKLNNEFTAKMAAFCIQKFLCCEGPESVTIEEGAVEEMSDGRVVVAADEVVRKRFQRVDHPDGEVWLRQELTSHRDDDGQYVTTEQYTVRESTGDLVLIFMEDNGDPEQIRYNFIAPGKWMNALWDGAFREWQRRHLAIVRPRKRAQ